MDGSVTVELVDNKDSISSFEDDGEELNGELNEDDGDDGDVFS